MSFSLCSYCEKQIILYSYACQCQPQTIVCKQCSQIQCGICHKKMKQIKLQRCRKCFNRFPQFKLYDSKNYYNSYCVKCFAQKYFQSDDQNIRMDYMSRQISRQKIKKFLEKFCLKCYKLLKKQKENSNPNAKLSLKNNICQQCQHAIKKQMMPKQTNWRIKQDQNLSKKNRIKNQMSLQQGENTKREHNNVKQSTHQLYENWKKIQQRPFSATCMSCGNIVSQYNKQSIITEQIIICSHCARLTKYQQQKLQVQNRRPTNRSRVYQIKPQQKQQQILIDEDSLDEQIKQVKKISNKNHYLKVAQNQNKMNGIKRQPIKIQQQNQVNIQEPQQKPEQQKQRIAPQPHNYKQSPAKAQKQQKNISLDDIQLVEQQQQKLQQNTKTNQNVSKNKAPELKKFSSETQINQYKIQIQYIKDQQLIQCSNCSMLLQANQSIWEQVNNVPLCRCCFVDSIEQLKANIQKRNKLKLETTYHNNRYLSRQRYMPKYSQSPQTQKKKQKNQLTKKQNNDMQSLQKTTTRTTDHFTSKTRNNPFYFNDYTDKTSELIKNKLTNNKQTNIPSRNQKYAYSNHPEKYVIGNRMAKDIEMDRIAIKQQKKNQATKQLASNPTGQFNNKKAQKIQKPFLLSQEDAKISDSFKKSSGNWFASSRITLKPTSIRGYSVNPKIQQPSSIGNSPYQMCSKCGNYSVLSDKYKINGKLVCSTCKGDQSLEYRRRLIFS